MKKIKLKLNNDYKSFKKDFECELCGDLIILSGVNGSGKSQLLRIIAKQSNQTRDKYGNISHESITRDVEQTQSEEKYEKIENIKLLSFRENINISQNFGQANAYSIENDIQSAWNFYSKYILNHPNLDTNKLIYCNEQGDSNIKNSAWRSILSMIHSLKNKYDNEKIYKLNQKEFRESLPTDFIWRNEDNIVGQVGNLFYKFCCVRMKEQAECGIIGKKFNNDDCLKNAPWTILNNLFQKLNFKYRFKDDYDFDITSLSENPQLLQDEESRELIDLSDGEKSILKLALFSMDINMSKGIDLMLFDEYDAPLNPSLTESFFTVIKDFYIDKGIQVIITTHSPATISLAPDYAQFYEIFSQINDSPKIINVNQFDYSELKEANKAYYDKIKNQENRIQELELLLKHDGNAVLVEDKYVQIYKIAYLKLKGITNLTKDNLDEMFMKNCKYSINGNYSTGGLYNILSCKNISLDANTKRICLFDFDTEGYKTYEKIKDFKIDKQKQYCKYGDFNLDKGFCLKHKDCKRYAMMIPIPSRLQNYVSIESSSDCFIEIETLLDEDFLRSNDKTKQRNKALTFYILKDKHKCDFWEDLLFADKKVFNDFEPLFNTIEQIFNS